MAKESFLNSTTPLRNDRLTGSDRRALLLWVVVGLAGALFALKYYFRAFPEASVNFQISRSEALERAKQFVTGLGSNVKDYQSSIVFDVDDNAKTYLERELGLEQANRVMASEVSIWYWQVRFFRQQQEEEYRVRVSPSGRIAGYEHKVPEARPGATLGRAAAETRAKGFLTAQYKTALSNWEFLPEEANSIERPKRLDWSFTWEKRGFRAKDAPYRLRVALHGDQIGGAEEFLRVPEAWERSYRELRSSNEFYNLVAIVPYALLFGAAIWLAFSFTRRGQTSWTGALKIGLAVGLLMFLMQANEGPVLRAAYDTKSSYGSFVATQFFVALLVALGSALTVALILPAAEPLYRASQPGRLRLGEALTPRGLRSKEFFSSAFVGLSLAAAHIGFVVAFYMVGSSRFGVWAPQDINYTESVNTAFPWISGVAIGLQAATSEEFLFRLFAIPFIERVTGSRFLAIVLPAFSWSFLHSAYPQEPGYIRGIEVGIIGIVAGLVMLRWGVLATLIWHYTVDALLVGLLLIRSNSLYFKISGAVVGAAAVAPLVFAAVSYLLRGRFEADEDLLNRAAPLPELRLAAAEPAETAAVSAKRYDALAPGLLSFLALCLILGAGLAWVGKTEAIGDYLKLRVDARAAQKLADEILRQHRLDPASYRHAATLVNRMDSFTNEYLRRTVGVAEANRIYRDVAPGALWRVRYFRDGQPEEYAVILRPDGALHSIHHVLPEAAPGASLTKDEAVARAENYLRKEKKLDLRQWRLVEAKSEKKPKRTDHTLTWEQNAALEPVSKQAGAPAPEAHARIEIQVLGDEVANYRTEIKIPDQWLREQQTQTLPRTLIQIGRWIFFVGLALWALILYLTRLRAPESKVPWRMLARWCLIGLAGVLLILVLGNWIPGALAAYPTEQPFKYFIGALAVGSFVFAGFVFGGLILVFGLAWHYCRRAFGDERLPSWTGMPTTYYRDALWIGLGGTGGLIALSRLLEWAGHFWPTVHRTLEASPGPDFDAILPAAAILGSAAIAALFSTGLLGLTAGFVAAEIRPPWLRILLFLLAATSLISNWGNPADFVKQFLLGGVSLAVVILGVRHLVGFNMLGYSLIVASRVFLRAGAELLGQPSTFYRANAVAVLVALALLLAWPLLAWRLRNDAATT